MEELETNESTESQVTEVESGSTEEPPVSQAQAILDLDKAEKFRFDNREWTAKELKDSMMFQSDYTKKTQALSEERKYYDNLAYDLDAVKQNPDLAEKFKGIYPEKFHKLLGYVSTPPQTQTPANNPVSQQPPEVSQWIKRLETVEGRFKEQEVSAINAELDAKFSKLSEKYPMADEEAVIARAQSYMDQGHKLDDKSWDKLWSAVHEKNQKLADQYYANKVKQQTSANQKGRDIAAGGGTPGRAPVKARSVNEAAKLFFESGADQQF